MKKETEYIEEDRISFRDVIVRIQDWIKYLFSKWRNILMGSLVIAGLQILYHELTDPVYTAETTFVLENNSSSGFGQFSSISSAVGVNLGPLSEVDGLFQVDNIVELYKSRRMLAETFMSRAKIGGSNERLITHFAKEHDLLAKWRKKERLKDISFEIPDALFSTKHDSLLTEVIKDFRDEQIVADKVSRQLSILTVKVFDTDQMFAKAFNETLVKKVNEFYLLTKTKKTGENVKVLQTLADSTKTVIDSTLFVLAEISENRPNPNLFYLSSRVPTQKLELDLKASATVYQEIVKNLEIAKVTHRNSFPLIQIIDQPVLPLEDNKYRWLKLIVLSGLVGGVCMVMFYTLGIIYEEAMKN